MPTAVAKTSVAEEPSPKVELLRKDSPPEERLSAPENFINRELSWLEFNRRVLEEAQDPTQPLIERVKFLTIFSSNLDRKSTRLNSSHTVISYAVFCLKKK